MKRRTLLLAAWLIGAYGLSSARAEEAKPDTETSRYLEQLQLKLDHAAQRSNQPSASGSSVVGLRGSKQEPLSKQLYWKGKKTSAPVTPDEVKLMRSAVEQARAGRQAEAITALRDFEQKFPKSALLPDAQQTLAKLEPVAAVPAASPPALAVSH